VVYFCVWWGGGGGGSTFPGGTVAVFEAGHLPELRTCVCVCVRVCVRARARVRARVCGGGACAPSRYCHTVSIVRRVVFPIQQRKESLKVILISTFLVLF